MKLTGHRGYIISLSRMGNAGRRSVVGGSLGWILLIISINLAVTVTASQIFWRGYPFGMDTFSHLPKVLYMEKFGVAAWYYDWYGGSPLFLFYPPVSYLLAFLPTLLGVNGMLSYKLIEFLFLILTPLVFYYLCRTLHFDKTQSLKATFILSIIPFTLQNSIVFGRFPNIVSYPFFLLAAIFTVKMIQSYSLRYVVLTAFFFALTLLTHHLSAYLLAMVFFIFAVGVFFEKYSIRASLTKLFSIGGSMLLGVVLSSVWIIPFLVYVRYYGNTGVSNALLQNSALALVSLTIIVFCCHYILKRILPSAERFERSLILWAILFFVMGSYIIPIRQVLPFGAEIDLMRFQLFGSVPLALLIARMRRYRISTRFKSIIPGLLKVQTFRLWIILFAVGNILMTVGVYQLSPVAAQQIYVEQPPQPIIDYLKNSEEYGRVLPIDVPYWVYVSPQVTGKELIDGWYPQGNLIKPMKNIRMPIGTLNDDDVQRFVITEAARLGVKWAIVGNSTKMYLFQGTQFEPRVESPPYVLLENKEKIQYVETNPHAPVSWVKGKDRIEVTLVADGATTTVKVKEAYFPSWKAKDNGVDIRLGSDDFGFMEFTVYGEGIHHIVMEFHPYYEIMPPPLQNFTKSLRFESLDFIESKPTL